MIRAGFAGLCAAAVLAACSGSAAEGPSPTADGASVEASATPSALPVECATDVVAGTVTIWHSMSGLAATDLWEQFEADFERTHDLELQIDSFAGDSAIVERLQDTDRSQWPDLVAVSEQNTRTLVDTGQFLPPATCEPSIGDDLLPLASATYTVDDELVALPFAVSVPVLVFDAAEFRRAGLDPADPPHTLAELLEASATLARSGASPYGLVLTDACANMVLGQYSAKRGTPESPPDNGHESGAIAVDYANPENIADFTALAQGVVEGHVKYLGGSESNMDDLVEISNSVDGGGTMTVHTSGALGDVIRLLLNFPGVELGVGPLPGPGPGSLIGGNALWLTQNADAAQLGRAWSVLRWLYEPTQLAQVAAEAGYVPPTAAAAQDPALLERWHRFPQLKVAYEQVLATEVNQASAGALFGPFTGRAGALYEACDQIMAQGADVATALDAASVAVNEMVAQYEAQKAGDAAPPPSLEPPVAPSAMDIAGTVECASGAAVVGVWVEAESGPDQNSGWAVYTTTAPSAATYTFTLQFGGRFQLHVGCGGSENEWGSSSFTMFVSDSQDFLCYDDPPRRGTCDTV